MSRQLGLRLAALLPVLGLVLVVVFALSRAIPGDPATTLLGPGATDAQIAALRAQLRLDTPPGLQFLGYLSDLARGDLGRSLKSGEPVLREILARLPATLELSLLALAMALLLGIPAGVLSAAAAGSWFDHLLRVVSLAGVSMPAFLLALLLQLLFGLWLDWLPVSGRASPWLDIAPLTGFAVPDALLAGDPEAAWDALLHLLLPASVLAAFLAATLGRYIRDAMLEVLSEDYVRTARAKGLRRGTVLFRHALRNALLPALTVLGLKFAEMLGGAVLTETVFAWPGIGRYMFDAIRNRDYPVIQGVTLAFALIFLLTTLAVDLLAIRLDPRLRRDGE